MATVNTENWELVIASFLTRLSSVQKELLMVLKRKAEIITRNDTSALTALAYEEELLITEIQNVLNERCEILDSARADGLPSHSLQDLATILPKRSGVRRQIQDALHFTRMIQLQSFTDWVLTQRSLQCVTQMLQIIGGRGTTPAVYRHGNTTEFRDGCASALIDRVA